jgi:Holliday junction resolvase-like predicted endonuclease
MAEIVKKKVKETDIAEVVITWLTEQNWTVYQEVEFRHSGGVADIVAERNGILWIIECKTSYTFTVLEQASRWPVHYRSVAVPRSREKRDIRVARDYYQVGVIYVDLDGFTKSAYEDLAPRLFTKHRKTVKEYLSQLTDLHKTYTRAGSPGGYHLTPYKRTMMDVQKVIANNPGCTVAFLHSQLGSMHYANKQSFQGNVLKCLQSFESEWCRVEASGSQCKLYIREQKEKAVIA